MTSKSLISGTGPLLYLPVLRKSRQEADGFKMASNLYLVAAVLSIFSLMTVKEIIFPTNASSPDKMDRLQKAAVFTGPTIKFLYW